VSSVLEAELLVHLDTQINSARRLLGLVLDQGKAIRARDVDAVLGRLADVQTEMGRRGALEQDRAALLQRAGAALGVPAAQVTLERLCSLVTPGAATTARDRSAELRGLLAEIAREHGINRALMRQELAFLAHLTRLVGQDTEPGYGRPAGQGNVGSAPSAPPIHRALDLQA
jgi:flagellar FlgN protein